MAWTLVLDDDEAVGSEFICPQYDFDIIIDKYRRGGVQLEIKSPDDATWTPIYETLSNFSSVSWSIGFTRMICIPGITMRFRVRDSRNRPGNRVYADNIELVPTA